ncbi:hypothetical protein DL89DRAFT_268120 [Linderina pennispora]|uniref:UBX domain-containing protein n=1 Tax=Linderina pennispora TaxID=61395 RepID=A0A1Y1W7F5_9FUNG|nr:uncharacterized protein DL89DRAFT_268120 [Linderina pennispora]ORX69084.1 hypothetical protein DL89DRAFT_268120 [Linderina pennispora]
MASDKDTLIEFGFPPVRIDKALKATQGKGLQAALDWLDSHQNDAGIDDPIEEAPAQTVDSTDTEEAPAASAPAQSLVCNECGKQFSSHDKASYHADFSESTEAVKPLTEEEKAARLAEIQDKIAAKRKAQADKDKEEQRRNEMIRRKAGQEEQDIREKLQTQEQLKAIAKQRQEKELDKLARQRVKEQIESDRKEREARRRRDSAQDAAKQQQQQKPSMLQAGVPKVAAGSQARLQIRPMSKGLGDIGHITHVFESSQTLADVTGVKHFKLAMTFPRKEFGEKHQTKTLAELGLAPSAALAMTE